MNFIIEERVKNLFRFVNDYAHLNPCVTEVKNSLEEIENCINKNLKEGQTVELTILGINHGSPNMSISQYLEASNSEIICSYMLNELKPQLIAAEGYDGQNYTLENFIHQQREIQQYEIKDKKYSEKLINSQVTDQTFSSFFDYHKNNPSTRVIGIEHLKLLSLNLFLIKQSKYIDTYNLRGVEDAVIIDALLEIGVLRGVYMMAKTIENIIQFKTTKNVLIMGNNHVKLEAGILIQEYNYSKWKRYKAF